MLPRKTPLKSHKPLKSKKGFSKTRISLRNAKPRTPINKVSARRKQENALYSKLRKEYLRQHPLCEACLALGLPQQPATEIHHKAKRYGKLLNKVELWLPTCRSCHIFIEANLREAESLGLIIRQRKVTEKFGED